MEYGNKNMTAERLYLYQGFDPANANKGGNSSLSYDRLEVVSQRDADLLFLWQKVQYYLPYA